MGSGIKGVESGIKGVGSGIRRVGSGITDPGSWNTSHEIGISSFLRDQGPKGVTILESRIRKLGTKMGSAMKKHTSLPPWYRRVNGP